MAPKNYLHLENKKKDRIQNILFQANRICIYNIVYLGVSSIYREDPKIVFAFLIIINLIVIVPSLFASLFLPMITKLKNLKEDYKITIPLFLSFVLVTEFVILMVKIFL